MNIYKMCMITDNNYAIYTGIALTSLKLNKEQNSNYKVYILCDSVSDDNKKRLNRLSSKDFEIVLKDVNIFDDIKDSLKNKNISATPTSIYKFMIPEILQDEDKVLYIDGDVLFYKDIKPLFNVDLGNFYAYVFLESRINKEGEVPYSCKRLNINHKFYFQSGCMYLNLKLLREKHIPEKLLDYRINGINFLMDQDTFNVVFEENVGYYEPIYSLTWYMLSGKYKDLKQYGVRTKQQAFKRTLIVHLATRVKPWVKKMPYITNVYFKYHKVSPFNDIPLHPRGYWVQFKDFMYEKLQGSSIHKLIHKMKGNK